MGLVSINGKNVSLDDAIIDAGPVAIRAALAVDFPDVENADVEVVGQRSPAIVTPRSATVVKRATAKG